MLMMDSKSDNNILSEELEELLAELPNIVRELEKMDESESDLAQTAK